MSARTLTPTKLRLILSFTLVIILAVSCGAFYLAYQRLDAMAADVGKKVADASDSQNTLQELQTLKQNLEANQDVMNKTAHITADSQNYAYQDQIVSDLTTYASRAGMTINNITFTSSATPSTASPTAAPAAASPAPAGLKTTNISVALKSPADYKGILNFLHYIEQNLTVLKIANVTLAKSDDDTVNVDVLNLEVYLR